MIRKLPADIARCPGREKEHPDYVRECCHCMRMLSPSHDRQVWVAAWIGHGDCPDKLEMEK